MGIKLKKYIRKKELSEMIGLHLSTLNRIIKNDPTFPPKIKIGKRAVIFDLEEINEWINSKKE